MRLGFMELVIILIIVLLAFGSTLLPKLAKGIGQSKKILDEELELDKKDDQETLAETVTEQKKADEE